MTNTILQFSSTDGAIIGYIVFIVLTFIIGSLITRWIFRIDTMVHYMKVQTELLIKIAKNNNVPVDEIYEALGKKKP